MREVDRELVQRAVSKPGERSCLLVDSRAACAAEAGELIDAEVSGSQVVEIGELVRFTEGNQGELTLDLSLGFGDEREEGGSGEVGVGPITMFKSVGVGLQDVAIACAVVEKAEETGVGSWVGDYDS
jgi:ornithine cyclodeaminase